ncbi:hypothetical protein [Actinoplanes sp. NPDC051859]|uniref:hypothetical protein n=1 Tax=Actinoplanes sp. NPDC051859 TaxID=3363909 RepID=UPI0037AABCBE
MHAYRTATRLAATITAAGLTVAAGGCHHDRSDPSPAVSASSPGAVSGATSPPSVPPSMTYPRPTYKAVRSPCDSIGFTALRPLLGQPGTAPVADRFDLRSRIAFARCARPFGGGQPQTLVVISTQRVDGGTVDDVFRSKRNFDAREAPVTDIPALGEGAYISTDPAIGTSITVHDGNLAAQITVMHVPPAARAALNDALTQTAREVLDAATP